MPVCPRGVFAAEVERILPPVAPVQSVALVPAEGIDARIEPGCVVPFRREPDERMIDVGRVIAKTYAVGSKAKPIVLGRGRLEVGRRALRLRLNNEAGDEVVTLRVDGAHVVLTEKGKARFEKDVSLDDDSELPLPLDALVAALDVCERDQRLGKTADGNLIEARRGAMPLWRSRWMEPNATAIVDTSVACGKTDTRLVWRSAVGELLPMLALASSRAQRTLLIVRQGPSDTEDVTDYGFDGMR
ncbi:MAG: hypothetical protein HYV09_34530 [Deltaproteobacteria bacterium]|nr:hypothetical protein [Deltaproteobacteria bacterium]